MNTKLTAVTQSNRISLEKHPTDEAIRDATVDDAWMLRGRCRDMAPPVFFPTTAQASKPHNASAPNAQCAQNASTRSATKSNKASGAAPPNANDAASAVDATQQRRTQSENRKHHTTTDCRFCSPQPGGSARHE